MTHLTQIPTNVGYVWGKCAANSGSHGGDTQSHVPNHSGEELRGVEINKRKGPGHNQFSCHRQGDSQGIELCGRERKLSPGR